MMLGVIGRLQELTSLLIVSLVVTLVYVTKLFSFGEVLLGAFGLVVFVAVCINIIRCMVSVVRSSLNLGGV